MSSRRRNRDNPPHVRLSKLLSNILRHSALKEGIKIRDDGYVNVEELMGHPKFAGKTFKDIQFVVDNNDKQRFTLIQEIQDGVPVWLIRANQGHSIESKGLSKMKRNHIHCAAGRYGDPGVKSGRFFHTTIPALKRSPKEIKKRNLAKKLARLEEEKDSMSDPIEGIKTEFTSSLLRPLEVYKAATNLVLPQFNNYSIDTSDEEVVFKKLPRILKRQKQQPEDSELERETSRDPELEKEKMLKALIGLHNSNSHSIMTYNIGRAVAEFGRHPNDTGSAEVQAAIWTVRILNLNEHIKANHKDKHNYRNLRSMVHKRQKILKYLKQERQNPSQGTLLRATQFLAGAGNFEYLPSISHIEGLNNNLYIQTDELPIRLAHRVKELDELPHNLSEMPSIIKVKNWYAQSFEELVSLEKPEFSPGVREKLSGDSVEIAKLPESEPNLAVSQKPGTPRPSVPLHHRYYANVEDMNWPPEVRVYNERFTKLIENIKKRHDPVVTTVGKETPFQQAFQLYGIREYKQNKSSELIDTDIQAFLDRFYMSRIGIRMLIGQHVALNRFPSLQDYVGIICTKTNIAQTVQEAAENAKNICEDYYGLFRAPEIQLHCPDDLIFTYVPSHLSHMLFELLKNSLRAIVEFFGSEVDAHPPIKVIVAEGKEDITIKISDEGGGIPRKNIPLVWTYMYTTAEAKKLDPEFDQPYFRAPMAGFGYGLPISRLYARYFGGDLKLISMEG
ncbi:15079_t:CDS:10, partial [Acaulospora colombiana]